MTESTPASLPVRNSRLGWTGPHLTDYATGEVIVNGTPPKAIDPYVWGRNGSLSWALGACSASAQTGGISAKFSVVEIARRLLPWLLASGWTPPEGEPSVDDLTALLREARGLPPHSVTVWRDTYGEWVWSCSCSPNLHGGYASAGSAARESAAHQDEAATDA